MGPGKKGLSKGYILAAVEDSLQTIGRPTTIDLYQSHVDDGRYTDRMKTLEAYAKLIPAGKGNARFGASNYDAQEAGRSVGRSVSKRACRGTRVCSRHYNLYERAEF